MYQIKNKIYTVKGFDKYKNNNMLQFNYYNNYKKKIGKLDNDIGWSCSIKSVQMLLSSVFIGFNFNYDFVKMFYNEDGIFSVHSFIKLLKQIDTTKKEGEYFGVYNTLHIYKKIIDNYLPDCKIHITSDNIIDISVLDFEKPTMLFFSTRLGLDKLESYYKEMIFNLFQCDFFSGILGGVGKACYYFMAKHICIDTLFYLDPHFISDYKKDIDIKKLKPKHCLMVNIDALNPSLTFCFCYKNKQEFIELKKYLEKNTIFNILHKKYFKKTSDTEDYSVD